LALAFIDSLAFLLVLVFRLLSGNLLAILLSCVASHLFVFSTTVLSIFSVAFLARNISAILLGNLVTNLVGNFVTDLPRLIDTVLLGDNRCNSLLDIMALANRNGSANRLIRNSAYLVRNIIGVRYILVMTVLFGNLLAFLSRFIPTLLLSIDISTFLLSDSAARFFVSCVTFLLLSVLLNWLLNLMALFFWNIMALFLCLKAALWLGNVVNLGFRNSAANLLIDSVALLSILSSALLLIPSFAIFLVLGMAFLLWNICALLLRNPTYLRHWPG